MSVFNVNSFICCFKLEKERKRSSNKEKNEEEKVEEANQHHQMPNIKYIYILTMNSAHIVSTHQKLTPTYCMRKLCSFNMHVRNIVA